MLDGLGCLPIALDVYLDSHIGPAWQVSSLRGRSGWLSIAEMSIDTPFDTLTSTIAVGCFDGGQLLPRSVTRYLLDMGYSFPSEAPEMPPDELAEHLDMMYWDFLGSCDLHHLRLLDDRELALSAQISTEEQRAADVFALVENHIADLRRRKRGIDTTPEMRQQIESRISLFEDKQIAAAQWLHKRIAALRAEAEDFEALILECLTLEGTVEPLCTLYWTAKNHRDRTAGYYLDEIVPSAPRMIMPDPVQIEQAVQDARGTKRTHALKVKWDYEVWKEKDEERRAKEKEIDAFVAKSAPTSPSVQLPTDVVEVNKLFRKIRERQRQRHKAEEEERRQRKTEKRGGREDELEGELEEGPSSGESTPEDLWEQGEISWRMKRRLEREQERANPKPLVTGKVAPGIAEGVAPQPEADPEHDDLPADIDAMLDAEIRKLIEGL